MNRGIEKETLTKPEIKGKTTKANPIRVDVVITNNAKARITEIAEAMKIEKAAAVRMLMWFAMRFATPYELSKIASEKSYRADGQSSNRLDTRITQEMIEEIEKLMKVNKLSKSSAIKTLLYWAVSNIGNYTIADWLSEKVVD